MAPGENESDTPGIEGIFPSVQTSRQPGAGLCWGLLLLPCSFRNRCDCSCLRKLPTNSPSVLTHPQLSSPAKGSCCTLVRLASTLGQGNLPHTARLLPPEFPVAPPSLRAPQVTGLIPGQGTCEKLRTNAWLSGMTNQCLSLSLSLSPKKINRYFLKSYLWVFSYRDEFYPFPLNPTLAHTFSQKHFSFFLYCKSYFYTY